MNSTDYETDGRHKIKDMKGVHHGLTQIDFKYSVNTMMITNDALMTNDDEDDDESLGQVSVFKTCSKKVWPENVSSFLLTLFGRAQPPTLFITNSTFRLTMIIMIS